MYPKGFDFIKTVYDFFITPPIYTLTRENKLTNDKGFYDT